jgi:low temperature requirement protein LtrA
MNLLQRTFRSWWQVPRRVSDRVDHRTVSFLELFYDLVYVVLIAEVAHILAGHVDLEGLGRFIFLFVIVWWAWLNGATYHDLHGNNHDLRTRVFTFLQMIFVGCMAVFAHDALGKTYIGFALSFAGFQLLFAYLWWRVGVYDPAHRPLSRPYVLGYLITTVLYVVSVWVPAPVRFYLWAIALALSLLLPFVSNLRARQNSQVQAQLDRAFTISHSGIERFGLFTIIVLGEVIVGVIRGLQSVANLDWLTGATAMLGMLLAVGIWWIYFDLISGNKPRPGRGSAMAWLYLHLPLTMGITAIGAAVLNVTEHAGDRMPAEVRWLLVVAVIVVLITIALLLRTLSSEGEFQQLQQVAGVSLLTAAGVSVLFGLLNIEAIYLLCALVAVMLTLIGIGLWLWIRTLDGGEVAGRASGELSEQ